jgi:uncharacterized protein involved in exopolysaccharide biosynthesis
MRQPEDSAVAMRTTDLPLIEVVNMLLRHWRLLLSVPLLLAVVTATSTLRAEREYMASASFTPMDGRASDGAGIARQLGLDLGLDQSREVQFYAALLSERSLLRVVLESEYAVRDADGTALATSLLEVYGVEDSRDIVPAWQLGMMRLRRAMDVSVDRATGIVRLTVRNPDPELAEQIATRLVDLLHQFNLESRQGRAMAERRFVEARLDEARSELEVAELQLKTFLEQNRHFENSPELTFEHDRLARNVNMRQQVYTNLLHAFEESRIAAVRDTPVLTVIYHPAGSAEPVPRGTALKTLLALVVGFGMAILAAIIIEAMRRSAPRYRSEYEEFVHLREAVMQEIRSPKRWIRLRTDTDPEEKEERPTAMAGL